ncbi:MAG TPA: epoxide hydrolase [Candidatus Limnocylindrales bacterium]|nr:epoxide hydrolase [Candidatus Limnocylindrales bacterium]
MDEAVTPFRIEVPRHALQDLRERLLRTRLPEPIEGAGWDYGIDVAYLKELIAYWRDRFDWRAVERELARYSHFVTPIDGLHLHFLHQRSPHPNAMPLLLTHGWPGSILEFMKILPRLLDPPAFGGDARDAFHVVCPSIPGYGFSQAPQRRGFDIKEVARTLVQLMHRLGYDRYGAQGGDWGAMATSYVGLLDPQHCAGIHLNLMVVRPPKEGIGDLSDQELASLMKARDYMSTGTAYQKVQGREPDLIGVAHTDSPAALCAWIVHKFRAWSDCDGEVERRFTKDELLANVTLYWLTRSAASAARLYYESQASGRFGEVEARVNVPAACAVFPREIFNPPRAWAERLYDIRRWTVMPSGGHFAAMEEPELLARDVAEFFRTLRA